MKKTIFKTTLFLICLAWLSPVFSQNEIVGTVNYHNDPGFPVPEVTIDLYDINNNFIESTITNDYGEYLLDSIPNGSYYLVSSTNIEPGEVTLQDAYMIMMHLFGMYDFTDCEFAAADVNGSGTITWSDYFIVLINYLLQGQPFQVGEWQFESVQIDFNSRTTGTSDTTTFWATGSGDLDGNWVPTGRSIAMTSSISTASAYLSTEISEIEIKSDYNSLISGFNLNIKYPNELMTVTGVAGPDENINFAIEEGVVKIIWMDESENPGSHVYGDQLCTLFVRQKQNCTSQASAMLSIDDQGMVLDPTGQALNGVEIKLPEIKSSGFNTVAEAIAYPNPVINELNIRIESNQNQKGTLYIYDLSGKLTREITVGLTAGETHVITLETGDLHPGSYTYLLRTEYSNQTIASGRFFKSK